MGRSLITQVWEYKLDTFPWGSWDNGIRIPLAPVQSVDEVRYLDLDGAEQVLDPVRYQVSGLPDAALISVASGQSWPALLWQREAITITFTAGYGDSWNSVPEPIRTAIGEQLRTLYDGCDNGSAEQLMQPWRMYPI